MGVDTSSAVHVLREERILQHGEAEYTGFSDITLVVAQIFKTQLDALKISVSMWRTQCALKGYQFFTATGRMDIRNCLGSSY